MHPTTRARRLWLACLAALVVALGLGTQLVGDGPVADIAGDALYAVMVYLVIALVLPQARPAAVGTTALALCWLIELFQLTGLPLLWAESFWPVRLILGVGFDFRDLVVYAVAAGIATLCDLGFQRRNQRRDTRRSAPSTPGHTG